MVARPPAARRFDRCRLTEQLRTAQRLTCKLRSRSWVDDSTLFGYPARNLAVKTNMDGWMDAFARGHTSTHIRPTLLCHCFHVSEFMIIEQLTGALRSDPPPNSLPRGCAEVSPSCEALGPGSWLQEAPPTLLPQSPAVLTVRSGGDAFHLQSQTERDKHAGNFNLRPP